MVSTKHGLESSRRHNGWTLQAAAATQLQTLQPAASVPPGRSAPRSNSVMPPRCSAGSGSGPTISSFSSRAASSACRAAASALADCATSHSLRGTKAQLEGVWQESLHAACCGAVLAAAQLLLTCASLPVLLGPSLVR